MICRFPSAWWRFPRFPLAPSPSEPPWTFWGCPVWAGWSLSSLYLRPSRLAFCPLSTSSWTDTMKVRGKQREQNKHTFTLLMFDHTFFYTKTLPWLCSTIKTHTSTYSTSIHPAAAPWSDWGDKVRAWGPAGGSLTRFSDRLHNDLSEQIRAESNPVQDRRDGDGRRA